MYADESLIERLIQCLLQADRPLTAQEIKRSLGLSPEFNIHRPISAARRAGHDIVTYNGLDEQKNIVSRYWLRQPGRSPISGDFESSQAGSSLRRCDETRDSGQNHDVQETTPKAVEQNSEKKRTN